VARLLALLSCGLVVCISDVQAQGHPPTPNAGTCGLPGNPPCKPNIYVEATTFTPTAQSPESGPFTYTITVNNNGNADGTVTVTCTSSPQVADARLRARSPFSEIPWSREVTSDRLSHRPLEANWYM